MTEHVWLIDGRVRRGSGESAAREAAILAGDGLFETLLVRAGQPVDLTAHLDRLRLSLEQRDWLREAPPDQDPRETAEVIPLTLGEPCLECGGSMRIVEIFRRGQKPRSRAPPRNQAA